MLKSLALLCSLLLTSSAFADTWSIDPKFRDPKTHDDVSAAVATNAQGYKVAFFRASDKAAYLMFFMPETSFDKLPLRGRIAAFRPDQNPAVFIETNPSLPSLDPFSLGGSVRARVWHGKEITPFAGTLRNILDGSNLTVRFFTDTGTTVDTVFELAGASPVIAKAVGFPETVSPEVMITVANARKLKSEAAMKCYIPSASSAASKSCMDAISACADEDDTKFDETAYRACLRKVKWPAQ